MDILIDALLLWFGVVGIWVMLLWFRQDDGRPISGVPRGVADYLTSGWRASLFLIVALPIPVLYLGVRSVKYGPTHAFRDFFVKPRMCCCSEER